MQIIKKEPETNQRNFVSAIMFRYLPYWPLFLILIVTGFGGAWLYLRHTTPLYEASSTILINDEKKSDDELNYLEKLKIPVNKRLVENEFEVLRSRKLMKEVVRELHLYAQVFEERDPIATSAYISTPVKIEARNPDGLSGTDKIPFTIKGGMDIVFNNKKYPLGVWVSTPYGELLFKPTANISNPPLHPLYFQLSNPRNVISNLTDRLKLDNSGKLSTVVELKIKDEVPQRAEDILNTLVNAYNKFSIDDKNRMANNTLSFVENRLGLVEHELDSLERSIQQFRTRKGVVDLSEQGKLFLQNVGDNDRKLAEMNMKQAVLDQVERFIISKDYKTGIIPSTLGIADPVLSQLLQKLYNAELEYEKLRKTTAENNPMMITVSREIELIRPNILENVRNQRSNLQAGINNLNATGGIFNAMLHSVPAKEKELTEISRQHSIKQNVYSFLLEKREQAGLAISSTVPDSKVVDMAVASDAPVSPKKPFIYMVAFFASIALGIGLISAKEFLNKKILFRSEIESLTSVPVVAEITNTKKRESLVNTASKTSYVADQFRQLRASIGLYGNFNSNKKKILVTSSISGEGKSYISVNLAISLALAFKKVVLIDLDIRNPKTSSLLCVADRPGVTEFLEGTKYPEEIISKTQYENLFTIGAGGDADNARELILNGKLKELLSYLETVFDYIIVDTSPIDPVTDAYVLSEHFDITLFIVRHGYTPKTVVQLMDYNNKIKFLKNPCIVFNDIRSRGFFVGNYGFGFGYGYQNVYREKTRKEAGELMQA